MRLAAAAAAAAFLFVAPALAADPIGTYGVVGNNPGGGSGYQGNVTIEKTGDTYRVTWSIGGTRYTGTGIGDGNFIAVSYRSGNETGLALYAANGQDWQGVWAYAGGREMGTERWSRR
jgi:hypothetical protein